MRKASTQRVRRVLFIFLLLYSVVFTLFAVLAKFLSADVAFFMGMWVGGFALSWFAFSYLLLWRKRFLFLGLNGPLALVFLPLFLVSFFILTAGIYYEEICFVLLALVLMVVSGIDLFWRGGKGEKREIKVNPRMVHLLYISVVVLSVIVCAESFGKDWLTFFLVLFALSGLTFLLSVPEKKFRGVKT